MSGHYRWIWPGTRAFSNVENRRNNVMRPQCSEQILSPVEIAKGRVYPLRDAQNDGSAS